VAAAERVRHPSPRAFAAAGLAVAVVCGGALRFAYANWDAGAHLHPDERYMSTVANDISWPSSPLEYLDVRNSPLSPYNTPAGRSYVYGTLPLFGGKLAATIVGDDDYDRLYLAARHVSALLDTASIALVFVIALLLFAELGRRFKLAAAVIAALLYAFTVTAIQHAHYFTVDSWLVFLTLLTFLLAILALRNTKFSAERLGNPRFAFVGIASGLTIACKVPGALVLAPVGIALLADSVAIRRRHAGRRWAFRLLWCGLVTGVLGYFSYRLVSPYVFSSSNMLNVSINPHFRSALEEEFRRVDGDFLFPPSYQWLLSTPVWDPLRNLVVWQLGLPLGIAALIGIGLLLLRLARSGWEVVERMRTHERADASPPGPTTLWLMLATYVLVVFFWIAPRFAHMGRYLVPITPFLAIAAAYALVFLFSRRPRILTAVASGVVLATALYALAFEHVYVQTNPRIAASRWLVSHATPGSKIANEHWDDSLPVARAADGYTLLELPVFEPDDATKLRKLYGVLSKADYYVLSSPRAWRTIGRLPDRFPLMTRFYRDLFAGKLGFVRVGSFQSEPQLFGVRLHDLGAEEAFWVYDHPRVLIYRRRASLDWLHFRGVLCPTGGAACT
jgi:MFS family permease